MEHDKNNPNPFLALFLDRSIPFNLEAKAAFLRDNSSKSTISFACDKTFY